MLFIVVNVLTDSTQPESETFKKGKKRCYSWIWKHTNLIQVKGQPEKYKCMYCEKTFVRNGTSPISRHLINKHSDKMKNTQCTMISSGKLVPPFKVGLNCLYSVPQLPWLTYFNSRMASNHHLNVQLCLNPTATKKKVCRSTQVMMMHFNFFLQNSPISQVQLKQKVLIILSF
jgi:hypothetical protein